MKKALVLLAALAPCLGFADDARWAGGYAGLGVGYDWSRAQTSLEPGGFYLVRTDPFMRTTINTLQSQSEQHMNKTSIPASLLLGYNYQAGNFVIGVEADYDYTGLHKTDRSASFPLVPALSGDTAEFDQSITNHWIASVRARVGYAWDGFLGYLTAGPAVGRYRFSSNYNIHEFGLVYSASASSTKTLQGWAYGGGFEYALAERWNLRGEYLYTKFANRITADSLLSGYGIEALGYTNAHIASKINQQILRVGLTYRF